MYQRATLPNGLRIICETIPHVHSVSLGIWVGTGSRYEDPSLNGISHFIEHMMFKGTSKRTTKQIAETIDAVGGQLNAFTTKEYTCYYAKLLNHHFQLGADLLADMVTDSIFLPQEIDKEKLVVLEEIKSYEDSPDELIHDIFLGEVLKDHSLGRSILGLPETIDQITRDSIVNFLMQHYTPDNIVFAVAGNIQFDQVMAIVQNRFAHLQGSVNYTYPEIPPIEPKTLLKYKDTEQVHICIGTRGVPRKYPKKYAVFLLDSILGGSVSSRLFQKLREEEGLVYMTGSSHSLFIDTGVFTIYAGTSMKNYELVTMLIKAELQKIKKNLVGPEELARAKEQIKGNLLLSLESTCNRMSRIAKSEMFNDELLTPEESVARIEAVTANDILEIADELFDESKLITTAIGPFETES